jgi:hypothetical protein
MSILQVGSMAQEEKYLGLPTPEGRINLNQQSKDSLRGLLTGRNDICQEVQKKC